MLLFFQPWMHAHSVAINSMKDCLDLYRDQGAYFFTMPDFELMEYQGKVIQDYLDNVNSR